MNILTTNKTIPKVVNNSLLYVESNISGLVNGRHIGLDTGLYIGNNNKWVAISPKSLPSIPPNDIKDFTYTNDTLTITLKDNTTYTVLLNNIKISINYLPNNTSYLYIVPYDLKINTVESSGPTFTITKGGFPYTLGEPLNQFDELLIQVNTNGLIILNGIKL
jgi:hypothetical protein